MVDNITMNNRYGITSQVFHWVTALVVLVAFIYGPGGSEQRVYAHSRDFDRQIHESLGLIVFVLTMLRLLWHRVAPPPGLAIDKRWMFIAAKTTQGILYLLLFAVPLSAIAGAWLEGHPLTLLAGIEIQPPIAISHELGAIIAEIHTWLGDAVLWVAGFHALAAIYHHGVLKDGVLVSMLPRWVPVKPPVDRQENA